MTAEQIIERGRRVLHLEAAALADVERTLGDDFARAIQLLAGCRGRVIIAGVGKSGLVGRKMAATFTSTGSPAMFLHPVEGVHGDSEPGACDLGRDRTCVGPGVDVAQSPQQGRGAGVCDVLPIAGIIGPAVA